MKKLLFIAILSAIVAGCAGSNSEKPMSPEEADSVLSSQLEAVFNDTTLSEDEIAEKFHDILLDTYNAHKDDSTGYKAYLNMLALGDNPDELISIYEGSSELIHESQVIKTKVEALYNLKATQPGAKYLDIIGVNVLTGDSASLSGLMTEDKPTLVDFWASWCRPCRMEIQNNLIALSKTGKVNIVGVAVWEETEENTRKAMEDLGITWPVIYSGGREDSPTVKYGVVGIPTLILIAPDGKIIARGHSIEEFQDKL